MRDENDQLILTHRGSGSGGYLDYVFRSAAKELFNIELDDKPLEFKMAKSVLRISLLKIQEFSLQKS